MMTTISDLPEDVLFRALPLKTMRYTCKKWNALSKNQILGQTRKKLVVLMGTRVCSMKLDLQGIRNSSDDLVDLSIKRISVLNQVQISQVFHCNGLLLCVNLVGSRLLVWNPYLGQTKWIKLNYHLDRDRNCFDYGDLFALGYNKNNHNHKILRILNGYYMNPKSFEIYDFSSDSWRFLDAKFKWIVMCYRSLKGNTYFFVQEWQKQPRTKNDWEKYQEAEEVLIYFDFTTERFGPPLQLPGPRLSMPFENSFLLGFCVKKDEQLAMLHQFRNTLTKDVSGIKIWVTNKIEPNAVTWSKFLEVEAEQFAGLPYGFKATSFFIDEEKKAAVIFGYKRYKGNQISYIVGTNGCFKSVNIKDASDEIVISSYVPSLVQL